MTGFVRSICAPLRIWTKHRFEKLGALTVEAGRRACLVFSMYAHIPKLGVTSFLFCRVLVVESGSSESVRFRGRHEIKVPAGKIGHCDRPYVAKFGILGNIESVGCGGIRGEFKVRILPSPP